MHDSSFSKMREFVDAYLAPARDHSLQILDVGARIAEDQTSYRSLFDNPSWRYRGLDVSQGPNVDITLTDPYEWREVPDASVDVVISGQALEHIEYPWRTMEEIGRVLRPGGLICIIVPSAGPEHRYPTDCWRFYPDGMSALARWAALEEVELFTDWGILPWQDSMAVLQKPAANGTMPSFAPQANLRIGYRAYRAMMLSRPRSTVYYRTLAKLQGQEGDNANAEVTLRIGLEICPESPEIRYDLLRAQLRAGSGQAAVEQAIKLLSLRPISPPYIDLIGRALHANGTQRDLFAAMLPADKGSLTRIASLAMSREQWSLAALAWDALSRQPAPPPDAKLQSALALIGEGKIDLARKALAELRRARLDQEIDRTTILQRVIDHRGTESYLEIGVDRGLNFFEIDAPLKIAVDPNFRIPGGPPLSDHEHFFAMTSDTFFENPPEILRGKGIHVALIDGLHTHAQALRDIENCLQYLKPSGVLVIHDCLPRSPAEAQPSLEAARQTPGFDGNWTGDVYRAIIELRCRRKDIRITVLDTDHGVGLIELRPSDCRLDMETQAIASLSYDALRSNCIELLNLKPPDAFDKWLETGEW
jgi:SAM-dependent methyltransferase